MSDINDIRILMKEWKKRTFKEEIDYCFELQRGEEDFYSLCINIIKLQKLEDKVMDGHSVEKLPIKNEGNIDVIFSKVFDKTINEYFSPGSYIINLIRECKEKNITDADIVGIIGRGYRSLPSFIRELDLRFKVAEALPTAECVRENPENDVIEHTDVLVKYKEQLYRLWSYQNTIYGLENTCNRLLECRGSIPFGFHVLCPFDAFIKGKYQELNGWRFYTNDTIQNIADLIRGNNIDDYSVICKWSRNVIQQYMKYPHIFSKKEKELINMTYEARRIINCIFLFEKKSRTITKKQVIDSVLGKNSSLKEIYERIKIEGRTEDEIELLIKQMITDGLISQSSDYNHLLKLENYEILKNEDNVYWLKKY